MKMNDNTKNCANNPANENPITKAIELNFQNEKNRKLENYRRLNKYAKPGQILFTGSSLMEHFPVCELYDELYINNVSVNTQPDKLVYNRGIGGYTTPEFLRAIDVMLLDIKPSKVFLNIGTNDMNAPSLGSSHSGDENHWLALLLKNYEKIIKICRNTLPDTILYIMAFYPVNPHVISALDDIAMREKFKTRTNEKVKLANEKIAALASRYDCSFIDVNNGLYDGDGNLKEELTVDGVHMYADAYRTVFENLKPYLF